MARYVVDEGVGLYGAVVEEEQEGMRCFGVACELNGAFRCRRVGVLSGGYEACVPYHASCVGEAAVDFASFGHSGKVSRGHRRGIGLGIAFEHFAQRLVELFGLVFGDVGQRVEEHELGHEFAQGVVAHHVVVGLMNPVVAVFEVIVVGAGVEFFLTGIHLAQILEIVRVGHGEAVFRVGEIRQNFLAPFLGFGGVTGLHPHEVEVIVCVEAVDVVGIAFEKFFELRSRGGEVAEVVFQNHAHIIEPFLNDVVGCLLLFVGRRNLGEVVFGEMGVGGTFARCFCRVGLFFSGLIGGVRIVGVNAIVVVVGVEVGGVERCLIAAAPVVFEFT